MIFIEVNKMRTPTTISPQDLKYLTKLRQDRENNLLALRQRWEQRIVDTPELKTYYEKEVLPRFTNLAPLPSQVHPAHPSALFHLRLVRAAPRRTRHLLIPDLYTFADLHEVMVDAFHLDDDHLHEFVFKPVLPQGATPHRNRPHRSISQREIHIMGLTPFGDIPESDFDYLETEVHLWDFFTTVGSKLRYIFDFGTSLRVDIFLDEILPADPTLPEPKLLPRARATSIKPGRKRSSQSRGGNDKA